MSTAPTIETRSHHSGHQPLSVSHQTTKQIAAALGITVDQVRRLTKAGMPRAGHNRYDPTDVRQWLIDEGYAVEIPKPDGQTIAHTVADAAQMLGVGERTIARWQHDPTFPGRAGIAGRPTGYYPIEQIRAWRGEIDADREQSPSARARLDEVRLAMASMDLLERAEMLVEAEWIISNQARSAARQKALLSELPDKVQAALPNDIDNDVRQTVRQLTDDTLREVFQLLADSALEDPDDAEFQDDENA